MKLDATKNRGVTQILLRSTKPATVAFFANDIQVGKNTLDGGEEFVTLNLGLTDKIDGEITNLRTEFSSAPGTVVEIDWIKIAPVHQ